jgi:hypothetical protein
MNTVLTLRFAPRPFPCGSSRIGDNRYHLCPQQSGAGDLHYGHGEAGTHAPGISQRQMLEVEINVLDKNNQLAARNRARFATRKQLVLNLVSSPAPAKPRSRKRSNA